MKAAEKMAGEEVRGTQHSAWRRWLIITWPRKKRRKKKNTCTENHCSCVSAEHKSSNDDNHFRCRYFPCWNQQPQTQNSLCMRLTLQRNKNDKTLILLQLLLLLLSPPLLNCPSEKHSISKCCCDYERLAHLPAGCLCEGSTSILSTKHVFFIGARQPSLL